jgi:hypothetical protein
LHETARRQIAWNDFVIVGPKDDPAHIAGGHDAIAAFKAIAAAKAPFISRGDKSGTNALELRLWDVASIDPVKEGMGTWYRDIGNGMGAALNAAWFLGSCDLSFSFASAFWRKYSGSSGSTWVRSSNRCPSFRTWASISLRSRVNCRAPLIGGPGSSLVCAGWRCRVHPGRSLPPGFLHLGGPARRTAMCGN